MYLFSGHALEAPSTALGGPHWAPDPTLGTTALDYAENLIKHKCDVQCVFNEP